MKRWLLIIVLISLYLNVMARQERDTLGVGTVVTFVENNGQWEQPYRFEAQLHDAAIFLEDDGITVALREHSVHPVPSLAMPRYHAYRMHFAGGGSSLPYGNNPRPDKINYLLGNNSSRWVGGVQQYDGVSYSNIYPGVDLEVYGGSLALKYNFIIHPGGDASQAVIEYEGTDGVEVTTSGMLRIRTSVRDIMEMKPYVFQLNDDGEEVEVESRWRVGRTKEGRYSATVVVGDYDHSRDLVIDPTLVFSTYTGSTADNWGTTATYDSQKNVYTAGLVFNIGYPTSLGSYQPTYGGGSCDIGIFKFDPTGSTRLFATYLGGSSSDMPHSLIVNSFDELIVFGTTGSTNFPVTPGAYQHYFHGGPPINYLSASISFPQGSDIFISRLSADGSTLKASTFIGGTNVDGLNYRERYNNTLETVMGGNDSLYFNYGDGARGELITDNLNNIYVGSTTFSPDFPVTSGCVQPTLGGRQDGVVFKLDHNLRNLLWSTYLGGTNDDAVYSIDVDSAYNLLVCGGTNSSNFPVTDDTYQTEYGGGSSDGFVSKISYGGERLMASTYVGDVDYDQLYFVRTGRHDEVFLFGQTRPASTRFIYNAGYSIPNSGMLLMRLSPELTTLRWSTLFGTAGRINLSPTAFAADSCNRGYAAGWGRDFVPYIANWNTAGTTGMETTLDAYSNTTDGQDFYLISLDANASNLEYASFFGEAYQSNSSYHGADHVDGGTSRFDRLGTLYQSVCASCGGYSGFPTSTTAWSNSNSSSNCNNALFRFNVSDDFPVAEFQLPPAGCAPYSIIFNNTGRGTSFHWDFGDGSTSTENNPTHTYNTPGNYIVTLIANQPGGCAAADTQRHTVQVLGSVTYSHSPEIACNNSSIQIGVTPAVGATYTWSGDPVSDPTVANPWVDTTGTYILHTSTSSCVQVDTFHVKSYSLIDQWQPTAVSCHDSTDGSATFRLGIGIDPDSLTVTVTPTLPIGPFTVSGGHTYFTIDHIPPSITYQVNVSGYGCSYSKDILLQNPPTPAYEKEYSTALCNDSCNGWIRIQYNLSAIPEEPTLDTLISGLCPGTYITHLTSFGCPLVDTSVIVRDHTLDSLRAWADRTDFYLGESVGLHAISTSGASYSWTPAHELDHPDAQHPIATPTDTLTCYRVVATSTGGCTASDTVCVHCTAILCGEEDFFIPNALTPNGDGINDLLCFNADMVTSFHFALFNRWGQCVYESDDPTSCWDATFRNTPCLAGVYTYTCRIQCHNGIESILKGDITLIR